MLGGLRKGVFLFPQFIKYRIAAMLGKDDKRIATSLQKKGKFIIATNEMDDMLLSNYG